MTWAAKYQLLWLEATKWSFESSHYLQDLHFHDANVFLKDLGEVKKTKLLQYLAVVIFG